MTQLELKLAERNDHGYELRRRRHERCHTQFYVGLQTVT